MPDDAPPWRGSIAAPVERDLDQPYERASEDPPPRREGPRSRMRDMEAEVRRRAADAGNVAQLSFLDAVQDRRSLLDHLRERHNRVLSSSYVTIEELRAVHAVLHETEDGR